MVPTIVLQSSKPQQSNDHKLSFIINPFSPCPFQIGPDHERHVFSRFAARQRDVLLSTLWTAVSGTGTALEAYLAKQMRGAAEGVGGVLPAGEAVLRSYKCAKASS